MGAAADLLRRVRLNYQALWTEPEADCFAAVAIGRGVPRERILIENRSSNTGENVTFTRQLLAERGIDPQKFIVVQKPYMERRAYATFRKRWPEKNLIVTSPRVSFDDYLERYAHESFSRDDVVAIMVGTHTHQGVRRAGLADCEEIPAYVWQAYLELVDAGYGSRQVDALS